MERSIIRDSLKRSLVQLVRRPIYVILMVVLPIACAWFFFALMDGGAIRRVPVGIVDLDNSAMSRKLTRTLGAMQEVEIQRHYKDYKEALDGVQRGDVMGFILLPADLSARTLSGRQPTISYYVNYSYYAPASMQFKGFKTITVLGNAIVVKTVMHAVAIDDPTISAALQPIACHVHTPGNPWLNYNYYLSSSFVPCLLALLIMLTTAMSIGSELKYGISRHWLRCAGDSISWAVASKLLPQTAVFTAVAWFISWCMFGLLHFPLHCSPWLVLALTFLLVIASQAWALLICCVVPNYRYASMVCSLMGIISFSVCAFSLPEESMYPWVEAIGYLMPIKYYFLVYADQVLNGFGLYYSRYYVAALLAFLLLPLPMLWKLKRECKRPVYVP